ncbi:MAG: hypothetical protein QW196_03630 [Sulfolobales archaeon]
MRFPPESLKEWVSWFIYPRFPRKVLTVYDRAGEFDAECFDEEIEIVTRTKTMSIVKCTRHSEDNPLWRSWAVLGEDPFQYADLSTPSEMFGVYTTKWTVGMILMGFFLFLFTLFLGFIEHAWWLTLMLVVYIVVNIKRFSTPSIQHLTLHEVGLVGDLPFLVPGPQPQSKLSMSQLLKVLQRPEMIVGDETVRELTKEIEALKWAYKRLFGLVAGMIERESDKVYDVDVVHKIREVLSPLIIEEVRENYRRLLSRRTRMMLILVFVALIVGLVLGFLARNTLSVGVAPP